MSTTLEPCVLLADRHHGLFEGIRGLLATRFDRIFLVTDRTSLFEGAARLQPAVILLDLSYAAGDLPHLVCELRRYAPAAKLLLLSVHDESSVMNSAVAAGSDGLVLKREIASDLMPAIDAVLAGRRYFSSNETR